MVVQQLCKRKSLFVQTYSQMIGGGGTCFVLYLELLVNLRLFSKTSKLSQANKKWINANKLSPYFLEGWQEEDKAGYLLKGDCSELRVKAGVWRVSRCRIDSSHCKTKTWRQWVSWVPRLGGKLRMSKKLSGMSAGVACSPMYWGRWAGNGTNSYMRSFLLSEKYSCLLKMTPCLFSIQ